MSILPLVFLFTLAICAPALSDRESTKAEAVEQDQGPDLPTGCEVVRRDDKIVLARCGPGQLAYFLASSLVPDDDKRPAYNKVLNGLQLGAFYRRMEGRDQLDRAAVVALLPSEADRTAFIRTLYEIRDSDVWSDGGAYAVYDILAEALFQPEGMQLLNTAILEHATSCDWKRLGDLQVADLVLHVSRETLPTFEALAECPPARETVTLLLLAAIGFARIGTVEKGEEVLTRLSEFARGNKVLLETLDKVRVGLRALPSDEKALRARLSEWLDLPM